MSFEILTWLLFFSAGLALLLALFAFQRRADQAAQSLIIYQVGIALVSGAYALELMAQDLSLKTFWVVVRYAGWLLQLTALPYFIFWYLRVQSRVPVYMRTIFFGLPILFFLVLFTNPLHHLYYTRMWLNTDGAFPMFAKTNGPFYWMFQVYAFSLHIGLFWVLLRISLVKKSIYRSQAIALALSLLLPVLGNTLYLAGVRPLPYLNLTPFSYLMTGLVFSWMLFRFRSLELRPIALALTFNRIPSAIMILDDAGYVTDLNHAAVRLLRIASVYHGGQRLERVCAAWPELAAQVRALRPGQTCQIERGQGQDRQVFLLEMTPLERGMSERIGDLVMIREITEQVEDEKTRMEQQRALSALEERDRMARELHDGLGQVVGYLTLEAQNALNLIETGQTGLARANLQHMFEVLAETQGDMRELLLGMRQDFSDTPDFFTALKNYIQEFSKVYGLPVHLHLPQPGGQPSIESGAELHLLRVIQESLSNTRKHARATHVEIFFSFDQEEAHVIIEDDGCGFDPNASSSDGMGLHFGLNIMRDRVAEMKGRLQIVSAPGSGTRVMVTAPLAHEATARRQSSTPGWRVVIADDHPLFRDGLRNLLLARGVDVVAIARNGAEAVEKALEHKPDIVILDIHMPVKDGIQAAAEIKQQVPDARILMLTMAADDETLLKAFKAGAAGYLLKDLKAEDFLVRLDALMSGDTPLPAGVAEKLLKEMTGRSESPAEELNERQIEILRMMSQRLTYVQIGERLHLSESTIKYHTAQIMEKLHVSGRSEALAEAANRGWIERRKLGR